MTKDVFEAVVLAADDVLQCLSRREREVLLLRLDSIDQNSSVQSTDLAETASVGWLSDGQTRAISRFIIEIETKAGRE